MTNSAVGLAGEVGEGSCGAAELVVEPDAGGEGEEFAGDSGADAVQGAGVVAFEAEAVFERPEDRLDVLADRRQLSSSAGFVFAVGAQQQRAVALVDGGGELTADVALVGDDHLAAVQTDRQQT